MKHLKLQLITTSLFVISFLLSALGQVGRIEVSTGVFVYLFEPVFVATIALMIWQLRLLPFQKLALTRVSTATAAFLLWLVVTLLLSYSWFTVEENIVATLYFLRIALYSIAIPYVLAWGMQVKQNSKTSKVAKFSSDTRDTKFLHYGLYAYIGFMVTTGFVQYIWFPDLRPLLYAGWDPHFYRLFGTYLEPVVYASISSLFVLFLANKARSLPSIIFLVVGVVGILLTFSRAAYLAVPLALFAIFGRGIHWKIPVALLCVAATIILLLPKPAGEGVNLLRTSTIESRSVDYQQGLGIFSQVPLLGIGFNHIGAIKQTESSPESEVNNARASFHSSFLVIAVTAGIPGLLLYLQMIFYIARMNRFLLGAGILLVVLSLFDNVLLHPLVLMALIYLGSLSVIRPSRT